MVLVVSTIELRKVHQLRESIEVKHGVVLTVLTKECDVLSEIHILYVVRNKAAVATLNSFAEFCERVGGVRGWHSSSLAVGRWDLV
jgi:hypothetical protein